MKTKATILLLLMALTVRAGDEVFLQAMGKQIGAVYTAQTVDELQGVVNALDRIGQAEKGRWEPLYYGAFGCLMMATREKDAQKKDGYLDQALERVNRGLEISQDNSELLALEGFVHMLRVSVDPGSRGQRFSGMSMKAFNKAIKADPNNPRALSLMAQMQYGTAQFFGSSTSEPCGMAKKALSLFDAVKNDDALAPRWGKEMTESMVKKCNP
ncbi:MAG: hypothetical protein JNL40_01165 [Cyclobacteriaceae bacterium]|nr:hypothetical protein [Cyclobacteriaceae bacterium]